MFESEWEVPLDEDDESWEAVYRKMGVDINAQMHNCESLDEYLPRKTIIEKIY